MANHLTLQQQQQETRQQDRRNLLQRIGAFWTVHGTDDILNVLRVVETHHEIRTLSKPEVLKQKYGSSFYPICDEVWQIFVNSYNSKIQELNAANDCKNKIEQFSCWYYGYNGIEKMQRVMGGGKGAHEPPIQFACVENGNCECAISDDPSQMKFGISYLLPPTPNKSLLIIPKLIEYRFPAEMLKDTEYEDYNTTIWVCENCNRACEYEDGSVIFPGDDEDDRDELFPNHTEDGVFLINKLEKTGNVYPQKSTYKLLQLNSVEDDEEKKKRKRSGSSSDISQTNKISKK
jgi:Fe-S-cluster containining protein